MGSRLDLHEELLHLLGSNNVYFQPPESVKMHYDAIVYSLQRGKTRFANDMPYSFSKEYIVTLISKNPDNDLVEKIATYFPMVSLDRTYVADNLNHWVYTLFY